MTKSTTQITSTSSKGKHLTYANRCRIETLLSEGYSIRYIADSLCVSPSTVSREIKQHIKRTKSHSNDCINKSDCVLQHICGNASCRRHCKTCNLCVKYCPDYEATHCITLSDGMVCNKCTKKAYCRLDKIFYSAETAEKEYRDMLVNRRNGFDLTAEEIEVINNQVSPLIMKGQSPYHIKQSLGKNLAVSESTLRRMINGNELDVRAIDLKEAVKRKPRKRKKRLHNELASPSKAGHMYEEYKNYINTHDVCVVEMDCVEGKIEDRCAILTLYFVELHMQLYYIMPEHTSECVVNMLDTIEETIGKDLFADTFPLLLTDNGHEFTDIEGMERSIYGGKRTMVYFCDPNRSDQKGHCENNHRLFRDIVPKGTSIDSFMQADMVKATNHINSYRRKSLYGKSPYDYAYTSLPNDFFIFLGLEQIPSEEVMLTPELLNHSNSSK